MRHLNIYRFSKKCSHFRDSELFTFHPSVPSLPLPWPISLYTTNLRRRFFLFAKLWILEVTSINCVAAYVASHFKIEKMKKEVLNSQIFINGRLVTVSCSDHHLQISQNALKKIHLWYCSVKYNTWNTFPVSEGWWWRRWWYEHCTWNSTVRLEKVMILKSSKLSLHSPIK